MGAQQAYVGPDRYISDYPYRRTLLTGAIDNGQPFRHFCAKDNLTKSKACAIVFSTTARAWSKTTLYPLTPPSPPCAITPSEQESHHITLLQLLSELTFFQHPRYYEDFSPRVHGAFSRYRTSGLHARCRTHTPSSPSTRLKIVTHVHSSKNQPAPVLKYKITSTST